MSVDDKYKLVLPDNEDAFIDCFGGVYEHSPWIARAVYPLFAGLDAASLETLAAAMKIIVDNSSDEQKLDLLRAHPDLAGRIALAGELTPSSSAEQRSAGLDQCSPQEYEDFQNLNQQYLTQNAFPFILAVSGLNRGAILDNFRARLENSKTQEFKTALEQVHKIAHIRLSAISKNQG